VARANLTGIGSLPAARVRLVEGSWYSPLPPELRGSVQLIVSNPPYVAASDPLPAVVAEWEPFEALVAGPTGLEAIAAVIREAPSWLARPGALVVELAPHQAAEATSLAKAAGFDEVEIRPDLAGQDRALVARLV
jgi:release factor glutamine methyltransferase